MRITPILDFNIKDLGLTEESIVTAPEGRATITLTEELLEIPAIKSELEEHDNAFVIYKGQRSQWRYVRHREEVFDEVLDEPFKKYCGVVKDYAVTTSGEVFSFRFNKFKMLYPAKNNKNPDNSYAETSITYVNTDGTTKSYTRQVHQLVSESFFGFQQGEYTSQLCQSVHKVKAHDIHPCETVRAFLTPEELLEASPLKPYKLVLKSHVKDTRCVVNHANEITADNNIGNLEVLTDADNKRYSRSPVYSLMSPEGKECQGSNLLRLCKETGADYTGLKLVNEGKLDEYEGWTRYKPLSAALNT